MKIAIFGAGQLGRYLKRMGFEGHEVDLYSHDEVDICDVSSYESILDDHDAIINCAAYTNVDKAEGVGALTAYNVNVLAVMNLLMNLMMKTKKIIHISSEVVYGSNDPSYTPLKEDDPKNPRNIYSQTKLQADEFLESIKEMFPGILILRPGWLFGPDGDHNFISKIMRRLQDSAEPLNVVTDEVGSLASVDIMWKVMMKYIDGELHGGIYNVANEGYASRWEVAKFIHDHVALDKPVPMKVDKFERPVQVAKNSCLDCTKLKTALPDLVIPTWQEDVERLMFN